MKDLFVPYEQSLQLKELGFDEPCFGIWIERGSKYDVMYVAKQEDAWTAEQNDGILAPLYQQAFRWFREKYQLHNGIYPYYDEYEFQIKDFRLPTNTPINGGLMPYDEAELACLKKLIQIIKTK